MRSICWLAGALNLIVAAVAGSQFLPGRPLPPGNLLQNPGFESPDDKTLPGWTPEKKAAGKGEIRVTGNPVRSGEHSLTVLPNRNNQPSGMANNPLGVGQALPAGQIRGKRVYIAGWLGAQGEASAVAGLYALKINGRVESVELRQSASGGKLAYMSEMLDVSNDRKILFLIVNLHVEGTSGAATFDDLYVGLTAPPSSPTEPTGAGEGLKAEIIVNPARDVRRIPATMYGTNLEWIRNGNGIFDPQTDSLNERMVTLTRDLGVSLLRFPGGIFADFYHWKNGTGPRRSRPASLHMPGSNETSPNNFGTDEALEFSRRTGAPLMITVNVATASPAEAVEWLQYIRARTGPGKAPPVTWWEIGNEQYVKGDAAYAKAGGMTPEEYVRRFQEFSRALKSVDPAVRIGAICEENYGRDVPHAYPNWTQQVLEKAGAQTDFISVHNGYAPVVADPSGRSVRDVYAAMWTAPQLIGQNLRELSSKLDHQDPGGRIKIAITEWGPLFHFLPSSPYVDHVKTLGSALYVASALKTFVETPRVEMAEFFKLVDPLFMGWIGPRDGDFIPTAPYYAFQMYTKHFGSVVVESSTHGPQYRNRQVGWVDTASNNPYLDAVASRSEDHRKVYILAVNRNFDLDIPVTIRLRDTKIAGATAWVLAGTGVDANTGTQLPKGVNWARQAADERNPRFERGAPQEISFKSERLTAARPEFEYVVPKHSIVSLEIDTP